MAPPGVSSGTTNRIRISDSGGPLTRAGVLGLAFGASAGAVKNVQTTQTATRNGNDVIVRTTTTATIDQEQAARAQGLMDAAVADAPVPLHASLEIASTSLGGDTSGWMYNIGFRTDPVSVGKFAVLRASFGLGFGRYTFHDRERRSIGGSSDAGVIGDYRYTYIGSPVRITVFSTTWLRSYFQADLNWVTAWDVISFEPATPSPWRVGTQVNLGPIFVQGEVAWSRMNSEDASVGIEVGIGF